MPDHRFHVASVRSLGWGDLGVDLLTQPPPFFSDDEADEWYGLDYIEQVEAIRKLVNDLPEIKTHFDGKRALDLEVLIELYDHYGWEHYSTVIEPRTVSDVRGEESLLVLLFFRKPRSPDYS